MELLCHVKWWQQVSLLSIKCPCMWLVPILFSSHATGICWTVFSPPCANARSSSSVSPSLGVLISSLRECCDGYFTTTEALQKLEKKKDSLTNLMTEELRQVCQHVCIQSAETALPLSSFLVLLLVWTRTNCHWFSSNLWQDSSYSDR